LLVYFGQVRQFHHETNTGFTASSSATHEDRSVDSDFTPIAIAARGNGISGLGIFQKTADDFTIPRVEQLIAEMNADQPSEGIDMAYGDKEPHYLRFWKAKSFKAPVVVFVHGGSWRSGTYLESVGSAKVGYLFDQGYAFSTVNYSLIPSVCVEEQVQEGANAVGYLVKNAGQLHIDPKRVILMGHSSGAHVATLLETDPKYLEQAGTSVHVVQAVISLDGSNYNALAEIIDSPGSVAENAIYGLSSDPERLRAMSPTYHAYAPNACAFLLLHVQRQGDTRQAVELAAALSAVVTETALHVFEGQSFEGHMQMFLRLGDPTYLATLVMNYWLKKHAPVN
jgi:acetyl esterase/lipase